MGFGGLGLTGIRRVLSEYVNDGVRVVDEWVSLGSEMEIGINGKRRQGRLTQIKLIGRELDLKNKIRTNKQMILSMVNPAVQNV